MFYSHPMCVCVFLATRRKEISLTHGLMSVSVADQGGEYYKSFCGYSGARRGAFAEEKSSRRLVGVILPSQHSLSLSLSFLFFSSLLSNDMVVICFLLASIFFLVPLSSTFLRFPIDSIALPVSLEKKKTQSRR